MVHAAQILNWPVYAIHALSLGLIEPQSAALASHLILISGYFAVVLVVRVRVYFKLQSRLVAFETRASTHNQLAFL